MAYIDNIYSIYLDRILRRGFEYEDPNRKGVIRKQLPELKLRHDLSYGFPIITTKKTFFKGAVAELLFFLSGSTDIRDLWRRGVNFWDKDWARFHNYSDEKVRELKENRNKPDEFGYYDMGRIYPAQYRSWQKPIINTDNTLYAFKIQYIDQLANVVKTLWENPMSTSMVVNAWNPSDMDNMCLPPCHYGFQIVGRPIPYEYDELVALGFYKGTDDNERIDKLPKKYGFEIHWQQRSTDFFLGTPINIQYYALLAHLLEYITGHKALGIQGDMKNVHLYDNQFEAGKEQLKRDIHLYGDSHFVPSDYLIRVKEEGHYDGTNLDEILEGLEVSDFTLDEYNSHPPLKAEMLSRDAE